MTPPFPLPGRSPGDLFDDFLDLHDQCVAAGLTEAAYHALAGALHCAEVSANRRRVSLVIDLARLQQRSPLSIFSAQQPDQTPLFESLAVAGMALKTRLRHSRTHQQG